jgi:hypothetical protein
MYYPQYPPGQPNYQLPYHQAAPGAPAPPSATAAPTAAAPDEQLYPDVVSWCQYLDGHKTRSKDNIVFAPYGDVLKKKGFIRITQLTLEFFSLKDLQGWLGIEVGTAILIMQYAKADIEAIKAGTLVFPM